MSNDAFAFYVALIALWLLVSCLATAGLDLLLGPDPDLDGPWEPRR
jgi:hypothetical protein